MPSRYTIATYQRGENATFGPWVEVRELYGDQRTGKMLQEEMPLVQGRMLHTIAVRWVGRGIGIYQIDSSRPNTRGTGIIAEVSPLHEGV